MSARPWWRGPRLSGPPPQDMPEDIRAYPNPLPPAPPGTFQVGVRSRADASPYSQGALQRVAVSPDQERPSTGTYFNARGRFTGLVAATGETLLGSFQIPAQNVGVVTSYYINAQTTLATTNIVFRLKENGVLKQGWDIEIPPGVAAVVNLGYDGESVRIPFNEGTRVDLTAQVFDAAPYDVWGQATGWFYSKELRAQWEAGL